MATTISSTVPVPVTRCSPAPSGSPCGILAGYSGLTRQAYELDLRQFASWCQQHQLHLFAARRADIEFFARDLEARGRARATITRRLCTVAGFYRYAVEEELLDHSPAAHVRWPRLDYESHATGLDRNELGALLVAAGLGRPAEHALIPCWRSTGCGSPKPPAPTSRPWVSSAATAPWSSPAKAERWSSSRSPRAPPGRSTWPSANAPKDPSSWPPMASGWTATVPADRAAGGPPGRDHQARWASHPAACVHYRSAGRRCATA